MIINVATAVGTQNLWKQERIVLSLVADLQNNPRVIMWTNLHGSAASPIAAYTPPSDGQLYIDMSDYIRAYPTLSTININDESAQVSYSIAVAVQGLINPASVIIPNHALMSAGALIVPPARIYVPDDKYLVDNIECEFYATNPNAWSVSNQASLSVDKRNIGQLVGGAFTISKTGASATFVPLFVPCDCEYAYVRWISFTGIRRCHILMARKQTQAAADGYALLPIDNEYIQINGRQDGFTLALDGLSRYDIWYYSDMLMSSKVEVSLDGATFDRVQVTTKSITIPDGDNTNGKLEININWKRYDAVAM